MQGGRRWPGPGVSDGLWSQVINQAGALLPEPALTPQGHLRRHCWSRQEGAQELGGGGAEGAALRMQAGLGACSAAL